MKISLSVSEESYKDIEKKLLALGFIIDDDAPFVLTERNRYAEFICGKDEDVSCHIPVSEVVYIESMGHDIFVHTKDKTYRCTDRLWQLEKALDPALFLRISNSVIIAKTQIKGIRSALSQKFTVTLSDGNKVDVTRSYYYIFKNEFGI